MCGQAAAAAALWPYCGMPGSPGLAALVHEGTASACRPAAVVDLGLPTSYSRPLATPALSLSRASSQSSLSSLRVSSALRRFALAQPRDVGVFGGIRPDAHNQQLLTEDPVEIDAAAQGGWGPGW